MATDNLQNYELMVIFTPVLSEDDYKNAQKKYSDYIKEHGGEDGYFIRKSDFGVIAQDVKAVFPQAVRTRKDGTLAVDYEKLCALAFQAIVEQEEKHKQDIQSLQSQIDTIMKLLKDKE